MTDLFGLESAPLPSSARVVAFEGREHLSTLFSFEIWVLVPSADAVHLDPDAVLLQPGTLQVLKTDGSPRWSRSGVWTSLELVHEQPPGDVLYRLTLSPSASRLSLNRHSRVWVDKTVPEILEDVLQKGGLASGYSLRLHGRYEPRVHTCQYRESNLEFLSRLTQREGIYWFFEESPQGDVLVLVDHKDSHEAFGEGVVRVLREAPSVESTQEGFRSFTARSGAASAATTVRDYDPLVPTAPPEHSEGAWARGFGTLVRHQLEPALDAADARRLATLRAELVRSAQLRSRGVGRVFDVRSGYRFSLEEHPRAALNQDYLCVGVTHHGRLLPEHGPFARFVPPSRRRVYELELEAQPAAVQFRPTLKTPWPSVKGVELGRVEGPVTSEYAQLDDQGRYRVKLFFDERTEHRPGETSAWVRMVQPHAGAPEGWHLPLRKDTEVIVAFVAGDPDRPMIVGAAPNAETPAPVVEHNHTQNVLHTGGDSRLEIEDDASKRYVDLSTPPQRTFIHLGEHHDGHAHHYITSTDGNGLIHTGGVFNVTVGGEKHEHVSQTVLEEYDQTQSTDTTAAVTETYCVDLHTTVAAHCQETYQATQTTQVGGRTVETCSSQETTVSAALDEHHGSQTTNVDALLQTQCATELFDTGPATHTDGTLTWNIHGAATINAGTFLLSGPQYSMCSRTNRVIQRSVENKIHVKRFEFMPFKLDMGIASVKLNGIAKFSTDLKLDVLTGQAYEATGMKLEVSIMKIGISSFAFERYAVEKEMSAMQLALFGLALFL